MNITHSTQKNIDSSRNSSDFQIITLDGGAAVGKSSTARALAERFHLLYVDTGMHYRALTFLLMNAGIQPFDIDGIELFLKTCHLESHLKDFAVCIGINGVSLDIKQLRAVRINDYVSAYAAVPAVREFLKIYQRSQVNFARQHGFRGMVMEGRDIGSVIFPDAKYRFFLYADESEREKRRFLEMGQGDDIRLRDQKDSRRSVAPLVCPSGAIQIDTTQDTLEVVVNKIASMIDLHCM